MATSLTPNEVRDFLENQRTLVLATVKKDGAPVMHALWFTYLDNAVYFNIQARSFKNQNIQRDNRVSCLVESGETYVRNEDMELVVPLTHDAKGRIKNLLGMA